MTQPLPRRVGPASQAASTACVIGGIVASILMLAACAQTAPPVVVECKAPVDPQRTGPALVGQAYGMSMSPMPLNSVQFGDAGLAKSMAIQNLYATRTPTGTVRLQARFVSCSDAPATVSVRTSFVRPDTAPAEPASAWKPLHLPPRATAVYEEFSISGDASSFLIEVTR